MNRRHPADVVLIAAALVTFAVAVIAGVRLGLPGDYWPFAVLVIVPGVAGLAITATLVLGSKPVRTNVALLCGVIVVMLPVAELVFTIAPMSAVWAIRRDPTRFDPAAADSRSRIDVVKDVRREDPDAYLSIVGNVLRGDPVGRRIPFDNGRIFTLEIDGDRVIPLTNASRRMTVYCNESGRYSIFHTDEHGFNNPEGLWGRPVDVALLGDSFVQGACVPPDSTMATFLRERSIAALAVGIDDFGPLSELALLREYVDRVRPRTVVWVFYEGNDFRNLADERRSDLLMRYLRPDFRAGLADRQQQIDSALTRFIDDNIAIAVQRSDAPEPADTPRGSRIPGLLVRALTLHSIRSALGVADLREQRELCCDTDLFETILRQARTEVEAWGGQLVFMYVPSGARYYMPVTALTHEPEMRARSRVLDIVTRIGLPIIDMHQIIGRSDDPRRFYYHNRSHFDPQGYAAAAEAIADFLRQHP